MFLISVVSTAREEGFPWDMKDSLPASGFPRGKAANVTNPSHVGSDLSGSWGVLISSAFLASTASMIGRDMTGPGFMEATAELENWRVACPASWGMF